MKEVHAGGRWPLTGYATTSSKFSKLFYIQQEEQQQRRELQQNTFFYVLLLLSLRKIIGQNAIYLCEIEEWIRGQLRPFPESIDEMEWEALALLVGDPSFFLKYDDSLHVM